MARIRTIKPEFFTSEDIVSLSPLARLLYIALWCEADREGRMNWKPRTFKLRYLPADDVPIDALCAELIASGLVVLYGNGLAYIPKFSRHQHLNPREGASSLPDPVDNSRDSDACARVSDTQVGREGKGIDTLPNGKGGKPPPVEGKDPEQPTDPKRELFEAGKSLLASQGMPKAQTGSFIAKLAKDYGNESALDAVRSAVSTQPLEAAAYLKATCQRMKGERKDPLTVPGESVESYQARMASERAKSAAGATPPPGQIRELLRSRGLTERAA